MIDDSKRGPLSETERWALINALMAANEQYLTDAEDAQKANLGERTVKALTDQAESVRRWAELIENASEVIIR